MSMILLISPGISQLRRRAWACLHGASLLLIAGVAFGASEPSCKVSVGAARANRIVNHCLAVSGAAPLACQASLGCASLVEHTVLECSQLAPHAPAYCQEEVDPATAGKPRSNSEQAESLARTATADAADLENAKQAVSEARAKLEPLLDNLKQSSATLKAGLVDFAKEREAARAAYAKYHLADSTPGSANLPEQRLALKNQIGGLQDHASALAKEQASFVGLHAQLASLLSELHATSVGAAASLRDLREANNMIDALVLAEARAKGASSDVATLRTLAEKSAAALKAAQLASTTIGSGARALANLAPSAAASTAALAQSNKDRQKLEKDSGAFTPWLTEVEAALKKSADRHRLGAPSAKANHCDIEQVDFRNFEYPNSSPAHYKNGKAADKGFADNPDAPSVARVEYSDLNADGKKEAIVFLKMPLMGPHESSWGELHFFELDDRCLVQELARFSGGITPGEANGRSYSYRDTAYATGGNGTGNVPSGQELVELRYFNQDIREVKRKPISP